MYAIFLFNILTLATLFTSHQGYSLHSSLFELRTLNTLYIIISLGKLDIICLLVHYAPCNKYSSNPHRIFFNLRCTLILHHTKCASEKWHPPNLLRSTLRQTQAINRFGAPYASCHSSATIIIGYGR